MSIDVDIVGQLVPNVMTMIVQLCSTLVLFLLVKKFLWKPIQNFFHTREEKMQSDLAAGEQAKKDALTDRQKALEELNEASDQSAQIVDAAQKEARAQRQTILDQANTEAAAARKKAKQQIEADRLNMADDMKKEMVDVAMSAAGKLIGEKSVDDLDRKSVHDFVEKAADHEE
jgi:F-type H+-transporting ATPase subunit b